MRWRSIKVKEETYEGLKKLGMGIGKAVDLLLKVQREKVERTLSDIESLGRELADKLLDAGVFDIRFKGAKVEEVIEEGDCITMRGSVTIQIPSEELRQRIVEVIRGGA